MNHDERVDGFANAAAAATAIVQQIDQTDPSGATGGCHRLPIRHSLTHSLVHVCTVCHTLLVCARSELGDAPASSCGRI